MQITENQHYVPRFYMKPFSTVKNPGTKKEKVLISFFQFKDELIKEGIPTKSVCSKKYFYDKDGKIENKLAEREKEWAIIFHKINNDEKIESEEYCEIKQFIACQIVRTKAMLQHSQEMAESVFDDILLNQFNDLGGVDISELIERHITPENNLKLEDGLLTAIEDLKIEILENETKVSFITSDVPIIITNPLCVHGAGLSNIGTIVFIPISPVKMIILFDDKLYGKINNKIIDENCINIFNKYQYLSADERLLAHSIQDFQGVFREDELKNYRNIFQDSVETQSSYDGIGTFFAAKSRSIDYYFDIPMIRLPKALRKIPPGFRETFPREYNYKTRISILCRIYREPDFIEDKELRNYWNKSREYSKVFLNYLDYYWNTPMEDRTITSDLMKKLKKVPVKFYPTEKRK